jgi:hypothetical protein
MWRCDPQMLQWSGRDISQAAWGLSKLGARPGWAWRQVGDLEGPGHMMHHMPFSCAALAPAAAPAAAPIAAPAAAPAAATALIHPLLAYDPVYAGVPMHMAVHIATYALTHMLSRCAAPAPAW